MFSFTLEAKFVRFMMTLFRLRDRPALMRQHAACLMGGSAGGSVTRVTSEVPRSDYAGGSEKEPSGFETRFQPGTIRRAARFDTRDSKGITSYE